MNNLLDLQSQIEKLQKQANEIKAKEFNATVQDIRARMHAFGITIKDLQTAKPSKASKGTSGRIAKESKATNPPRSTKKAKNPVAPKYIGPNGETWSGRGLTPRWLATLVTQGNTKESFLVSAQK
jgi:DNA-binding protein H-NS